MDSSVNMSNLHNFMENTENTERKDLNKWLAKNNECIRFHTGYEGSGNGLRSMEIM